MASTINRLLHHIALFLLLAQLTDSALVPKTDNHPDHKPQQSNTYIVHANYLAKPPHFATPEHWYHSMVAAHSPRAANTSGRILYTYGTVMDGFAVQLTGDEARRMSSAPGVSAVYKDRLLYPQTTRSPGFIGLDPTNGAWNATDFGDGVIIGLIDTGIWPESASFNDSGLGPVRPSWGGKCVDADDFRASLCNNKLVGAKAFDAAAKAMAGIKSSGTVPSPRDKVGHGTHVASTAAGAEVPDAGLYMFSQGTARGIAPKARIAMYKACGIHGCSEADIVAAVDAAVKDGVDIISMSLGGRPSPFHDDAIAIATFGAERKGIFVALAGGNEGPDASTVSNSAPWMTTVGAATVDRLFPANLTLGNGVVLAGQSLYTMQAKGTGMIQLLSTECGMMEAAQNFTPDNIMGKIVVCTTKATTPHGIMVQNAGGAGLVAVDTSSWSRDGIPARAFTLPALTLSLTAGKKLKAYMASVPNPVASFSFGCETVTSKNRAPVLTSFSSRGPNLVAPELLKPDVIAPGVNILAAWPGDAPLSGDPRFDDGRRAPYNIISGTSMACPHVAGVAALIRKKYPSWTPAMIRSALMTTAGTLDNRGRDILDNGVTYGSVNTTVATPLVVGAGHIHPQLALYPGLVYDAGERDYVDFLCAMNYTAKQLRLFVPDFVKCTRTLAGGPAGLNYPSFVVVFDNRTDVRTLTRTVTKVSEMAETYNVTVVAPEHVKVTVTPTTLEFKERKETKSYTVEFRNEAGGNQKAEWDFGHIIWENKDHRVRSPVAFQWKNTDDFQ
ncbi:subtilisin-like protease SBT1.8 [Phragmites australis]|uniref:subtilisin-like protease SBT1.8 n=1 Tax=Phragmites australis TaxID=29695 RepID=UPI002D77E3A6|nr:subtilisin-like protease SBT1.8 [Phragmites australis]